MEANWNEIIEAYQSARQCLWCPQDIKNWHREQNEGYYHLWRAYHLATSSDAKQPLWYARILYMMAREQPYKQSDHTILNAYLRPCMSAYAEASQRGDAPTSAEYEAAKSLYDLFTHVDTHTDFSGETLQQAYSYIEGLTFGMHFQFHDSQVVHFSHDSTSAQLCLQFEKTRVTLLFEDVYEITIRSVDPMVAFISDFFCYPAAPTSDRLVFDIGLYSIQCMKIRALQE